jgi:cysteine desulfuration protein SufE
VSGLIAVLLRIYSGRKPRDILDTPPDFIAALNLERHLSPTRSTGLYSMLKAIRRHADEALEAA